MTSPDIHRRQVALSSQLRYQPYSRALSGLYLSETEKASENRLESAVVYIRRRQIALSVSHIFLFTVAVPRLRAEISPTVRYHSQDPS